MVSSRMLLRCLLAALAAASGAAHAARFTYHGELMDGDAPADGRFDLRVRALPSAASKRALAEATELPGVAVVDGRFSVELELPEAASGETWVEVAVRAPGEGDYEVIGAPQAVPKVNGSCPGAWALDGNSGVPTGSFLGLADPASLAPLELRARNTPVARFAPLGNPTDVGDAPAVLMGSFNNVANATGATVGGGGSTRASGADCASCANRATGSFSTVAGGRGNLATAVQATVGGGGANRAQDTAATVAGGTENNAAAGYSVVGGGQLNSATQVNATVAGGRDNHASAPYSQIGGGDGNLAEHQYTVVGGGSSNSALGFGATVAGGRSNTASGRDSAVAGGTENLARGSQAFAMGYSACAGGDRSVALGDKANTRPGNEIGDGLCASALTSGDADGDEGSFVFADTDNLRFSTTGPNQFLLRARGGVGINTAPPLASVELTVQSDADDADYASVWLKQKAANGNGMLLSIGDGAGSNDASLYIDHFNGVAQARRVELLGSGAVIIRSNIVQGASGVTMAPNAGSWSSLSDRRLKTAIQAVDTGAILDRLLATPISTWSYIAQGEGIRHLGPMAQDFAAAFGLGENDTTIATIDADGVALAAIQGLNAKLERENAALRAALADLSARIDARDADDAR